MSQNYACEFNIMMSLFDVKLKFLAVDPIIQANGQTIEVKEEVGNITLSIPIAKQFAKKLREAIESYETQFSEIIDLDANQNALGKDSV